MPARPKGIFVIGTDTGIGKTRVTCWIAEFLARQGVRAGVCKPAVTGARLVDGAWVWDDIERLRASCRLDVPPSWIGPFRWKPPLAPPAAARDERRSRDPDAIELPSLDDLVRSLDAWDGSCDLLLVEGIGGLLCPLTERHTVADLAAAWDRPVLVVARAGLGTLNHTLLTVEVALARGLDVIAVLLNKPEPRTDDLSELSNPRDLTVRLPVPVWGPIPHLGGEVPDIPEAIRTVDWLACAAPGRVRIE